MKRLSPLLEVPQLYPAEPGSVAPGYLSNLSNLISSVRKPWHRECANPRERNRDRDRQRERKGGGESGREGGELTRGEAVCLSPQPRAGSGHLSEKRKPQEREGIMRPGLGLTLT